MQELYETPTWAVAAVWAAMIISSLLLAKGLGHIGEWFKKKSALGGALEKVVKAQLMMLGFMSLLLVIYQSYLGDKICIPESAANTMLPCRHSNSKIDKTYSVCADGKVPLMSEKGLLDLDDFISLLAAVHTVHSASVMALGRLKIRSWKQWEEETMSINYEFSTDPSIFRFTRDTSFLQQHASFGNRKIILMYIVSFFRQFIGSIRRTDYLTLRHCFIDAHLHPGVKFNFQKYIKRSLDHDFIVVIGISPILWACGVIIMLLNVYNFQELFWVTVLLLVLILAIGTKLQAIIATMTLQIQQRHAVIQGMPVVRISDNHFWFGRPRLILFLIHFTLFVNAFQFTYFLSIWDTFGLHSCFHEKIGYVIARICIGITVHLLSSYVTLPLYALVTQMRSHIKMSIFDENTSKAFERWYDAAKKRDKHRSSHSPSVAPSPSPSPSQSPVASPTFRHLYQSNTIRRSHSDNEFSDGQTELAVARSHELSQSNILHSQTTVDSSSSHEPGFTDLLTVPYSHTPKPMPDGRPCKMYCFIDRDDGYWHEMERLTSAVVMSVRHIEFNLTIDQVADLAARTGLVSKTEVSVRILSRSRYLIHLPRGLATETFVEATHPSLWDEGYDFQPWDPLQDASSITIPSFKVLVGLQDIPPQLYREKEIIRMVSRFGTYLGTVAQNEQAYLASWLVAIATDDLSRIPHGIALMVGGLEFLVTVHPLKWTSGHIYTVGDLPKPHPKYSNPEEPLEDSSPKIKSN